jgi:hypothetical protein
MGEINPQLIAIQDITGGAEQILHVLRSMFDIMVESMVKPMSRLESLNSSKASANVIFGGRSNQFVEIVSVRSNSGI